MNDQQGSGNDEAPEPAPADLLAERRAKLDRIREAGIDPFPHEFADRELIAAVRDEHSALEAGEETESSHRVAGRITARRGHGKAAFIDLRDASGKIQLHAHEDVLGDEAFAQLDNFDIGDMVGVTGTAMATRRGELAVGQVLGPARKSLRPPPDKFHGLEDVETRYRRRELDLIANEESRRLFTLRAKTVSEVRGWLDSRGFIEVETPVLQPLYGGALARPFVTHHNALDRQLYLRIATELYLKRLIVGGIERVYELGKDFRNEGISPKHNPEFTMLEWYEAYGDYNSTASDLETMVSDVAQSVLGTTRVKRGEVEIDLSPPWNRVTMRDVIFDETGIDITVLRTREELAEAIGGDPDPTAGWGKLVDTVFSKRVEPKLIEPTFVLDYPVELSPFAKSHRTKPGLVERWEAFCGGMEIANSFTELNDPDEQRRRFEQQGTEKDRGDDETQPYDESFIEALEQGMPPTGGVGLGIDRLVMILTGASSVRETILFPAMRT